MLKRARAEQAAYRLALGPVYRDEGHVCTQKGGSPLRPITMASNIKRLFVKAGLPEFSMHSLLHTHVTMLLGDPSVFDLATSHRVGHDDVGFTHRQYGHALVEMQRPAAALMDATFGEIQ
ncbi:MAG TPA: hypothetical protein VJ787_12290 [Thermoleophilia bacterium]|nr:hypothetical protein [Thermoleophilia bacterium]